MTEKDIENTSDEESTVDTDLIGEAESTTKTESTVNENNDGSIGLPFTDVQLVGGVILVLLVIAGGFMLFGGGAGYDSADDFNYPEWADENGLTMNAETQQPNTQLAFQSHDSALTSSSYTISIDGESQDGEGTQQNAITYTYDSDVQAAFGIQESNQQKSETYEDYNTQEQFIADNIDTDDVNYDRQPLLQQSSYTAGGEFVELMAVLDVEAVGTTNNGDVVVYEIIGINQDIAGELPLEITGEIMLHTDGYFTGMDITLENDAEGVTTTQVITISNVGSTTVDQPDWYDTAVEQTDEIDEEDIEDAQQQQQQQQQPPIEEEPPQP